MKTLEQRTARNKRRREQYAQNPDKGRAAVRRWAAKNPDKIREKNRRYAAANLDKVRQWERKGRLKSQGLTVATFDVLLKEQGGCCAICRADRPGRAGNWHVDHDHKTDVIRGLLCLRCNTGLGLFRDDIIILLCATDYLRKHDKTAMIIG